MSRAGERLLAPAALAVLAGAILGAYANSFGVPFLFDDGLAISQNDSIRSLAHLRAVVLPLAGTTAGRPLVNLSLALNYLWGRQSPWGYHLVNLGIHLLAALTLFGLLRRALRSRPLAGRFAPASVPLAAVIAGLWSLHPLQTEAVTYISERSESLMALFYLFLLYGLLRSAASPRPGLWLALSAASCFLGMATKEVMVTAPLMALILDRALMSSSFGEALRRRRRYYLGLASSWLLLAYLLGASSIGDRGIGFRSGVSPLLYALTELKVVALYAKLTFWPRPLVFDYGPEFYVHRFPAIAPYAAVTLAAIGLSAMAWRRSRAQGLPAVAFFLTLLPTSSFFPIALQPMAESRMYLPSAALISLVVLAAYSRLGTRVLVVFVAVAAGLGCLTARRNEDYRSAVRIWEDTVAKQPHSSRARTQLGVALEKAGGDPRRAASCFRAALALNPDQTEAIVDLADLLAENPRTLAEAEACYERALRLEPRSYAAENGLGNALMRTPGRLAEAIEHYRRAVRIDPASAEAHGNLGVALGREGGEAPAAIAEFQAALRLDPDYYQAYNDLGNLLAKLPGGLPEAVEDYERALRIRPDEPEIHFNLATQLERMPGRQREAIGEYEEAVRLAPGFAAAQNDLGVAYLRSGRIGDALERFRLALRADPTFAPARKNLAAVEAAGLR